jgi:hypothetical protein
MVLAFAAPNEATISKARMVVLSVFMVLKFYVFAIVVCYLRLYDDGKNNTLQQIRNILSI